MTRFLLKHWRRITIGITAFLIVAGLTLVLGLRFPQPMLRVAEDLPTNHADCIVVLGGEYWTRVPKAISLYQSKGAPVILLSGEGDALDSRNQLLEQGVPDAAILMETNSTSTAENARFSLPILRERGFTNIILVTSWYHSRRALNCFKHYGPDLTYVSCPTQPDFKGSWPNRYERPRILKEYGKLLWYWPRHGIPPF